MNIYFHKALISYLIIYSISDNHVCRTAQVTPALLIIFCANKSDHIVSLHSLNLMTWHLQRKNHMIHSFGSKYILFLKDRKKLIKLQNNVCNIYKVSNHTSASFSKKNYKDLINTLIFCFLFFSYRCVVDFLWLCYANNQLMLIKWNLIGFIQSNKFTHIQNLSFFIVGFWIYVLGKNRAALWMFILCIFDWQRANCHWSS